MKARIQISDDDNRLGLVAHWEHKQGKSKMLETDAYCVAGECGILAFFFHDRLFCIASGDDGFWRLIYVASRDWFESIHDVMRQMFNSEVAGVK